MWRAARLVLVQESDQSTPRAMQPDLERGHRTLEDECPLGRRHAFPCHEAQHLLVGFAELPERGSPMVDAGDLVGWVAGVLSGFRE